MQVSRRLAVRSDLYFSTVGCSVGMVGGCYGYEDRDFWREWQLGGAFDCRGGRARLSQWRRLQSEASPTAILCKRGKPVMPN